jgi:serine/threonine protein kinase/WD40 repeat protein
MIDDNALADPLEDIAAEFVRLHRSGENISVADFAARYPDHAARLERLLPTIACMERCRPTRRNDPTVRGPRADFARLPRTLGDYLLLREAGRGGMGIVYEAEQTALGRRVALKLLSQAATADGVRLIRFRREAQAAARLHHTNIVPVFGVGEADGQHFYAMQYIDGWTLRDWLSFEAARGEQAAVTAPPDGDWRETAPIKRPQEAGCVERIEAHHTESRRGSHGSTQPASGRCDDTDAARRGDGTLGQGKVVTPAVGSAARFRFAAEVGRQVAEALAHAHEQGILHRDIKPSNLLIDQKHAVWVADFGLAKLDVGEDVTGPGDFVGTMRYMAPEQLLGHGDARSDLYALGLTIYEIVAGRPAFDSQQHAVLMRQVTEASPLPLCSLAPASPRDLATIVEKLIDRDPARRYQTAQQAADEFQRFLRDEPITARPPGPVEKLTRVCRRNPVTAGLTATALLLPTLVAVGWGVTLQQANTRTSRQLERAEQAERDRTESLFGAYVAQAQAGRTSRVAGQRWRSVEALDRAIPLASELELAPEKKALLRDELIAAVSLPDLRPTPDAHDYPADAIDFPAFDATLSHYARSHFRGVISVRRMSDDRELVDLLFPTGKPARPLLSPGGTRLAAHTDNHLVVWDWSQKRILLQWMAPQGEMLEAAFASENQLAVRQQNGEVLLFDLDSGRESHRIDSGLRQGARDPGHFAVSRDGARLALSSWPQHRVQVHDTATGTELARFELPAESADVAWSDDGRLLAATCRDFNTYVWNVPLGRQQSVLRGHRAMPHGPAFTRNGDRLVTWSWDRTMRLWDPWNGLELARAPGLFASLASDGRRVSAIADRQVVVYHIEGDREFRLMPGAPASAQGRWYNQLSQVSKDGRWLAVAGNDGVRIFDLARGAQAATLPVSESFAAAFHDGGEGLLTRGTSGVFLWPFQTREGRLHIGPPHPVAAGGAVGTLAQAGSLLAIVDPGRSVVRMVSLDDELWAPREFRIRGTNISLSCDSRTFAVGVHNGAGAAVYDVSSGERLRELLPDVISLAVRFSVDGRWLVTGSRQREGVLIVWDTRTWKEVWRMPPPGLFDDFACSPDGTLLAVSKSQDRIELRRLATGELLAGLTVPEGQVYSGIEFGRGGAALIGVASDPPYVALWDLPRIRAELAPRGLDWDLPAYPGPASDPDAPAVEVDIDLGELR